MKNILKWHEILTLLALIAVPGGIIYYLSNRKPASQPQMVGYSESQNALANSIQNNLPPIAPGGGGSATSVLSGASLSNLLTSNEAANSSFASAIKSFLSSPSGSGSSSSSSPSINLGTVPYKTPTYTKIGGSYNPQSNTIIL